MSALIILAKFITFAACVTLVTITEPALNRCTRNTRPAIFCALFLIAAGAVIVVLLIWGLSSLFAGKSGGGSLAAGGDPATELTLCALDQVRVKVVQVSDKAELFQGTLSAGERKTLSRRGSVYVTTTSGKSLKIEMNGKRYDLPFEGYDRAEVGVR